MFGDEAYKDGYRAAWREVLGQAAERLGVDEAGDVDWEAEKQEIEEELRGLWFSFVHDDNNPYPEGGSLIEVLRRFGEQL